MPGVRDAAFLLKPRNRRTTSRGLVRPAGEVATGSTGGPPRRRRVFRSAEQANQHVRVLVECWWAAPDALGEASLSTRDQSMPPVRRMRVVLVAGFTSFASSSERAPRQPLPLTVGERAERQRHSWASPPSRSAVAPIGDTEMLTRALGPGAGLVTHRRACPRHLTATPPN